MSDELILEEIYSTHVHSHTKFDAESLFNIAADILKRSTHVVENVVQ
ncbi:sieve element occlusion protein, partial [Trifolium pratense]